MRKKEAAWKDVLAASDEEAKERCMESYGEEKIKVCIYIYIYIYIAEQKESK